MKNNVEVWVKRKPTETSYTLIFVVAALILSGFFNYRLYANKATLTKTIADQNETIKTDKDALYNTLTENSGLQSQLADAQKTVADFGAQISQITGTVGTLQKISQTDHELLQKYSRVYFLNENYAPKQVSMIPTNFVEQTNKTEYLESRVLPFLQKMFNAAAAEGVSLKVISGYRSFKTQTSLKNSYTMTFGTGANKFSADQGYSEHQLGTAVDVTTTDLGTNFDNFAKSPGFTWLQNNAYKYGFILSYPKDNSYYQFEPWHWRFVGLQLAARLFSENKHFYDVDQREIDKYIVSFFDDTTINDQTPGPSGPFPTSPAN